MKKLFSEIPYLQGDRITLKQIKDEDVHEVISKLYSECFQESIILGIYMDDKIVASQKCMGIEMNCIRFLSDTDS